MSVDVAQIDVAYAHIECRLAGLLQRREWSGGNVAHSVFGEEAAEVQRHVAEPVVGHPLA